VRDRLAAVAAPPTPIEPSRNFRKHTSRNPLQRALIERFHRRILGLVQRSGATSILEVGCGEGFVLRHLREQLGPRDLAGLDYRPAALAVARTLVPGVPLQVADARHLPYRDGAFDLVLCLEVLEHLVEPSVALAELRRVARRGALLSVPHEPYFRLANLLRGQNLGAAGNDPEHCQHWGPAAFAAFVGSAFPHPQVTPTFPWLIAYAEVPGDPG
jgi:SAM-dependent methyltransferase